MKLIFAEPHVFNETCCIWDNETDTETRCLFYDKTPYTEWCNHPHKGTSLYCAKKECGIKEPEK